MNYISKSTLSSWLVLALLVSETHGTITVECFPIGGTGVTGGQTVEVECFVTTDVEQEFIGYLVDLPCSLPGQPVSSGTIGNGVPAVNLFHGGFPNGDFLFSPRFTGQFDPGLGVADQTHCVVGGNGPPVWPPIVATLPAGESAYLGTMFYEVSDCATGEFNVILENFSDPPDAGDMTKFFERFDESFVLIPFSFAPLTLTVVTGTCCDGSTCLEDGLNEFCCGQTYPGATFRPPNCPNATCCRPLGDVFPPGGNGVMDIDDLLCGLQGFADMASCPDADLIPCGGNGIIDIDDIVALLSAFAGTCSPCP